MFPKGHGKRTAIGWMWIAGASVLLSGCARSTVDSMLGFEDRSQIYAQRQPQAQVTELSHTVNFATANAQLTAIEAEQLKRFIDGIDPASGDRVFLVPGYPRGLTPLEASRISDRRTDAVASFLARNRVRAELGAADASLSADIGEGVTVVVRRLVVALPECPDWTGQPGENGNNQPTSNFGCATTVNFGMMLADPRDLIRGQDPGLADGELLSRSIYNYRRGQTKELIRDAGASDVYPSSGGSSSSGSPSGN